MIPRLRRYIASRLMWTVLGSGILAGGGAIISGSFMLEGIVASATEVAFREAENRFAILDQMLSRVEQDTRSNGRAALAEIARRYPTMAAAKAAGMDTLQKAAADFGVDGIYFIGSDGIIGATSFEPDLGLDLFGLSKEFRDFLQGLAGSGRYADQRLSMSTQTAHANSYQYYAPPAADHLIEVSTRLGNAIPKTFPGFSFPTLLKLLFNTRDGTAETLATHAVDLIGGGKGQYRSYIKEEFVDRELADLADQAVAAGGSAERHTGSKSLVVKAITLSRLDFDFVDVGTYAVFLIDRSLATRFALVSTLVSLCLIAAAVVLVFLWAGNSFQRHVAHRLEVLELEMEKVASGDDVTALDDGLGDEISSIGRSAGTMVEQIRERNAELSAFAVRLEEKIGEGERRERVLADTLEANQALVHEMNHRVNNNLQLAMSLAAMQARTGCTPEAQMALERMNARLGVISMVQDHALKEPDRPRVDMDHFLADICADIAGSFGSRTTRINRIIKADGIEIEPDATISIGLIVAELIDNAYRHAFAEAASGSLSVTLRAVGATVPPNWYELVVSDDGVGTPQKGGMGLDLAEALVAQLGGKLTWHSDGGTRVTVTLRLA